jgi:hypothetical protein
MKKVLSVLIVALIFTACKKDDEKTAGGGLLEKMVLVDGGDSTVGRFTYDGNNRISEYLYISSSGGVIDTFRLNLTRDAAGRIMQVTQKENSRTPAIYNITYNGSSSQLKSVVIDYTADKDSFSYVYNGNTIVQNSYYKYAGGSYSPTNKQEYTVQNGNIVTVKDFDLLSGATDIEVTNTYDANKPAQFRTVEEVLITGFFEPGLSNNITKSQTVVPSTPSLNDMITLTYSYASSGQPLSAVVTGTNFGTGTLKYYYK